MATSLFSVYSKSGKEIRLSHKTWNDKIRIEHPEFAVNEQYPEEIRITIEDPDYIVKGWGGELLALRWCETAPGAPKFLCVVYRELNDDGFVITSFFISRYGKLLKREIVWRKN
jgi:hypothetical protein